jgi:hypothetical protein
VSCAIVTPTEAEIAAKAKAIMDRFMGAKAPEQLNVPSLILRGLQV